MKSNKLYKFLAVILISTQLLINSCSGILDEEPRSSITSALFETEQGIELTLYGIYSKMRDYYASIGYYAHEIFGTDEVVIANGGQFFNLDEANYSPSNSGDGQTNLWWAGDAFSTINACNGIIEKGSEFGIDARKLAEARTIRALLYFNLVQHGGGAPLDLGSGELAFNIKPNRKSVRNSVPECYAAMIADLKQAITDMAGTNRDDRFRGVITKTFAQFLLSKVQLTYGWWIEYNSSQAPSGVTAAALYQEAYNTAMDAINDSSSGFGLIEDYGQVHLGANDRNKEILFYADRDYNVPYGPQNGSPSAPGGFAGSGSPENAAFLCTRMNFDRAILVGGFVPIPRGNTQETGRPWYRAAPSHEALINIFNNKEHDSRYFGTFQVAWTYYGFPTPPGLETGLNGEKLVVGDTVWYIPAMTEAELLAKHPTAVKRLGYTGADKNGEPVMPCFYIPGKPYLILPLDYTNRLIYPSLWKLGPYNPTLGNPLLENNNSSVRPYNIAKFSELYLIAAEAHVKGATGSMTATQLLNILRSRAAYRSTKSSAELTASVAFLTSETPASPDIDFILDERMRELYGEGLRWTDLVRTKKLSRAVRGTTREFVAGTATGADFAPLSVRERPNLSNIPDNSRLYVRPIPLSFINTLDMSETEKQAYQNPGYTN